jgi:tetratricopeptide (TPR) repeat protein
VAWIAAQATERARERRYASVPELADDLRRHLAHEPVTAGPPSAIYRLRKLVRRHRYGFAASAAVLVVAALGLWATWSNAALARERLMERNVQLEIANEANAFLTRVLSAVRPRPGAEREVTLRAFIDASAAALDADPPGHPAVEAQVRCTLAETYGQLGLHAEALAQYDRALPLVGALEGADPERVLLLRVRRLLNLFELGPLARAREESAAAAQAWTEARGPDDPATLWARLIVARCDWKELRHADAEAELRDLIARLPPPGIDDLLVHTSYTVLAQVLVDRGRAQEALAAYEAYLRRGDVAVEALDPESLQLEASLATLLVKAGRMDEGIESFRRVVPGLRRVYGPEHMLTMVTTANLARLLVLDGRDRDEAERHLDALVETARSQRGRESAHQVFALLAAADALNLLERFEEGEELARASVAANERLVPEGSLESYRAYRVLGSALLGLGRLDEGEEALLEGLGRAWEKLPEDHELVREIEAELTALEERR